MPARRHRRVASPRGVHVTFGVLLTGCVATHWFAAPRTTLSSLARRGPSGVPLPAAPAVIVKFPPPSSRGLRSPPGGSTGPLPCRPLTRPTVPLLGFRSLQRIRGNGSGSPGLTSPGTLRLRSSDSLGVFLPIPPPTHISEWSALGIFPSGLCTSCTATPSFESACLPGVSRSHRHRPRSMDRWSCRSPRSMESRFPTARPPSRRCSMQEPVSTTGRSSPAMGRSPLGFHPP
jgi:hypothetical protein